MLRKDLTRKGISVLGNTKGSSLLPEKESKRVAGILNSEKRRRSRPKGPYREEKNNPRGGERKVPRKKRGLWDKLEPSGRMSKCAPRKGRVGSFGKRRRVPDQQRLFETLGGPGPRSVNYGEGKKVRALGRLRKERRICNHSWGLRLLKFKRRKKRIEEERKKGDALKPESP